MTDSTHCQLLYSPLSSRAFLNMHALHFPATFQIQMSPALAPIISCLLSHPASSLCNSSLFCGWPNFQVWSILQRQTMKKQQQTDRQAQRHIKKLAWMPVLFPLLCPLPSTLSLLCQNSADSLSLQQTHACAYTTCMRARTLLFHHTVWSEERMKKTGEAHPSSHWSTVTGWTAKHPHLQLLCATYSQTLTGEIHHKRGDNSLEGNSGVQASIWLGRLSFV